LTAVSGTPPSTIAEAHAARFSGASYPAATSSSRVSSTWSAAKPSPSRTSSRPARSVGDERRALLLLVRLPQVDTERRPQLVAHLLGVTLEAVVDLGPRVNPVNGRHDLVARCVPQPLLGRGRAVERLGDLGSSS